MSILQSKMDPAILHSLIKIKSPSNFETKMREHIKSIVPTHSKLSIISDKNTSLAFYLNKGMKQTVLIDAHMDEISGQIVSINNEGFLTVTMTGPLLEYMHGRPVILFSSKTNTEIKGTLMVQHAHLKNYREDNEDFYNKNILHVDIGSSSKKESLKKIEIGDPFVLDYSYYYLKKNIITSRGLDNKFGVYILIHILKYLLKHMNDLQYNVIFNFSGDEETGKSSISHLNDILLDSIIVIDTDWSSDTPFLDQDIYGEVNIGRGPVLTRSDEDDGLFGTFKQLANTHSIPLQIMVPLSGGSMLSHYIRNFTAKTQFIGVPLRNIHSPVETGHLHDCVQAYQLIVLFLSDSVHVKKYKKTKTTKTKTSKTKTSKTSKTSKRSKRSKTTKTTKTKKNKTKTTKTTKITKSKKNKTKKTKKKSKTKNKK